MESGIKRPATIAIGLAIVGVIGVILAWSLTPPEKPTVPPGLTEVVDLNEVQKLIEISRPGIVAGSNYLGHRVFTVSATLRNISSFPVRLVDVKFTYRDYEKRIILEETHPAFEPRRPPLEPGTEYRFEISFENPPQTWNHRVPEPNVVRVAY